MTTQTVSARTVLASASAAQAAVAFVNFGLPAIGPELRRTYGLSLPELGAVLTAGLLGSGLALLAAGLAVDRFGTRRSMLSGSALACCGLVLAAIGSSAWVLFVALLASGVGSAVVPVAGAGALFRIYPPARRGWALGVRQTAVPLGGTIAALVLPALESAGGVRLALLVGAGLVGSSGVLFALAAGVDVVPRETSGLALRRIVALPGMVRLLVVAGLYIVVLQAVVTYSVPAVRAAGMSPFAASAAFLAVNVAAIAARLAWGRIADRAGGTRRARTLVEVGLVAAAGGVLFAVALHGDVATVVAAAICFGFGAFGWNAIVYVSAGERASPELAARSVAVAATVVFVLSAVSAPPLGLLADRAGWDAFWLCCAAIALAGAYVASSLGRVWRA